MIDTGMFGYIPFNWLLKHNSNLQLLQQLNNGVDIFYNSITMSWCY